jgi:hypothetical protein
MRRNRKDFLQFECLRTNLPFTWYRLVRGAKKPTRQQEIDADIANTNLYNFINERKINQKLNRRKFIEWV